MEATLGAAFLTGGIPMALRTGDALGLAFGGARPWSLRYGRSPEGSSVPAFFEDLQESLGYRFHESWLLVEAVTHPSFVSSGGSSYQRLEFLGDGKLVQLVLNFV
jgi:endoribonuclease Dicer